MRELRGREGGGRREVSEGRSVLEKNKNPPLTMWGMVTHPLSPNVRGNRFRKGIRWRVVLNRSLRGKGAGKGNKFIFLFFVFLSLVRIPFPGIALLCFALLCFFALLWFALLYTSSA